MKPKNMITLKIAVALVCIGLMAPSFISAQGDNIGLSSVVGLVPDPIPAGAQTLCFTVDVYSDDFEYMDYFAIDLPDGWTVGPAAPDSVPPASGCSGALPPMSGVAANNNVYWQSTGYPPQTGCGAWTNGIYDFCVDVTVPDGAGSPWMFDWFIDGDGYGVDPHFASGSYGPVAFDGGGPAIDLTKTVGTVPAVCAGTNSITVSTGTMVYYCYSVENTGDVTFEFHGLVDDQLGTLLGNFPYTLAPGATYEHIEPATISATVVNSAEWTATDALGNYTWDDTINYGWEDISATGTSFALIDDDTLVLPIGFNFDYYGVGYTDIEISSNGFLSVNAAGDNGCCTGLALPDISTPDGVIAGWWEDLDPGEVGAEFYYETLGTAPNRRFIVSVVNVQHYPSGNPVTLQYKLFESTDVVEVHYQAAPSDGGTHSAGIENQDGTVGVQYYLGPDPLAVGAPLAVRYTPETTVSAFDIDTATVTVVDPDITVAPPFMTSTLMTNQTDIQILDIGNVGTADLLWTLEEAPPVDLPPSDGNYPRGFDPPSAARAPVKVDRDGSHAKGLEPLHVRGELAYGSYFDLSNFLSYLANFDTDTPGTLNTMLEIFPFYPAMDFVGGDFTTLYALDYDVPQLVAIDAVSGAETVIGPNTPNGFWSAAAGDPTTGVFYGSSSNCGTSSTLYTIDLLTGAATMVGDMGVDATCVIGIAINSTGEMYGFDIVNDSLLSIDKTTGAATLIGSIGYDANYSQGCDFDEVTDTLYFAAYNNASGTGELRIADTTTGNTTLVGLFGGSGLFEFNTMAIAAGGACSNPSDLPWLSAAPTSGTTPPASTDAVNVTFDSTGLPIGLYEGVLCVRSNDPDEPLVEVPVTLDVVIPVELMKFTIE